MCPESLHICRRQGRRFVFFTHCREQTDLLSDGRELLRIPGKVSLDSSISPQSIRVIVTIVTTEYSGTVERTPSTVVEPVSWCTNLKIENNRGIELFESRALASRRYKVPLSVIRTPTEHEQTPKNLLSAGLGSGIAVMRDITNCYCPRFVIRFLATQTMIRWPRTLKWVV
jgi:hypothetical protein